MLPILIDLSRWKPLGLTLESMQAKLVAVALLAAVAYALGALLSRRREKRARAWTDPLSLLCYAGFAVVGVGLLWVVGRVHSYGMMMALGFLTALAVARVRIRRAGEDPEVISNVGILALIGGVVGSRISYIIEHGESFGPIAPDGTQRTVVEQVIEMFKLTSGGLVFDGGLILAIVLVLGYLYFKRLPIRRFLDVLAVSVMIGLAFGRVGCFLNGCCYGGVCSEQFAAAVRFPYSGPPLVYPRQGGGPFPPEAAPSPVYAHQHHYCDGLHTPDELIFRTEDGRAWLKRPGELDDEAEYVAAVEARSLPVHPAQLYGVLNALVLAGLLAGFNRLRTREGQVFAMLLIAYPATRFILEYIRDDNPNMTLTPAQVKCLILAAVGAAVLALLTRLPASCGPTLAERTAEAEAKAGQAGRRNGRQGRRKRKTPSGE